MRQPLLPCLQYCYLPTKLIIVIIKNSILTKTNTTCIRQSFYPLTVLPVIFVYSKDLCICAVYKTYLLNEYLISPQVCIDIMEFCCEFISTCTQILDQTMFSLPQHKFKELISVCSLQWHYHTSSITDPMAKPKTMWTETFPIIYV